MLHLVNGVRTWRLGAAGRARTGIERPEPVLSYKNVKAQITIGSDLGEASSTLVEEPCDSGTWRVGR